MGHAFILLSQALLVIPDVSKNRSPVVFDRPIPDLACA